MKCMASPGFLVIIAIRGCGGYRLRPPQYPVSDAYYFFTVSFLFHFCIEYARMRPEQDGTSTELLVIHTDPEQDASSAPSHHDDDNKTNPSQKKKYLSGWRLTLTLASLSCLLVLALNLGFTLWAIRHRSPMEENENNKGVLYEGPCVKVKGLDIGLHFVINILSTVLLAASNYCMVC